MKILFMSNLFPKETEKAVRAKMKFDMYDAANVLQWNLIDGIEQNNGGELSVVNLLPVDSWPQYYTSPFVPRYEFAHKEGATDVNTAFCNVKYIKAPCMNRSYKKEIKKWEKKTRGNDERVVILYSLKSAFLKAVTKLKKINASIKVVAVVADLPEFTVNQANPLRRWYAKHVSKELSNHIKDIDGFVLLTEHMATKMGINKPYMVMEGIVPRRQLIEKTVQNESVKTVLYTGSMNGKYGILSLLEAFSMIQNPNYRLILCGLGNAESEVHKACQNDSRIQYLGKVSHEKVMELQSSATVVINPRQNNEEFTKYSFPSKTMEYLACGVPLIAYKLDGIPDEYDEYINYVPDNSPLTLARIIQDVCELSSEERAIMGQKAQRFVLEEKNNVKQTKRILNFIKGDL